MPASDDECVASGLKHRGRGASVAGPASAKRVKLPREKSLKAADPKCYDPAADNIRKANAAGVLCRHCRKGKVNRPKGLCWGCYYAPGVRDMYPTTSRYARRGVRNFPGAAELATVPTLATPGTPEKVAVMAQRAEDERALFHPCDARFVGDPVTLDWLAEYARRGFTLPEARAA